MSQGWLLRRDVSEESMSLLPYSGGLCYDSSVGTSRGPYGLLICFRCFEQGWVSWGNLYPHVLHSLKGSTCFCFCRSFSCKHCYANHCPKEETGRHISAGYFSNASFSCVSQLLAFVFASLLIKRRYCVCMFQCLSCHST